MATGAKMCITTSAVAPADYHEARRAARHYHLCRECDRLKYNSKVITARDNLHRGDAQ